MQNTDWVTLYEDHGLSDALELLRSEWASEYDFVLLDSRTGVTDIGALCTMFMPDILFFVFTANNQSLNGSVETVRRAQAARRKLDVDRSALYAVPILSRFDSRTEYALGQKWLEVVDNKVKEFFLPWAVKGVEPRSLIEDNHPLCHILEFW